MNSFFDFLARFEGDDRFQNAIQKARRVLETKHEFLLGSDQVPFAFPLARRLAKSIFEEQDTTPSHRIWLDFEIDFLSKKGDPIWLQEILLDCTLFVGCELLNLCMMQPNDSKASLAYSLILGICPLFPNRDLPSTLFLVAKVPTLGKSKTRLAKSIGDQSALEFAVASLLDSCERFSLSAWSRKVLLFFPPSEEEILRRMLPPDVLQTWTLQPFDDHEFPSTMEIHGLGVGLTRVLKTQPLGTRVGFLGMDTPHLTIETVNKALFVPCIVPARDGGYTLLSFTTSILANEMAFSKIAWSTNLTCIMQVRALQRSGISYVSITDDIMFDVDNKEDLIELLFNKEMVGSRVQNFLKAIELAL